MENIKKNLSQAEKIAQEEILDFFKMSLGDKYSDGLIDIIYPPKSELGTYTVPCFLLAKKFLEKPDSVSQTFAKEYEIEIRAKGKNNLISRVYSQGPYLNFFVDTEKFNSLVLRQIISEDNNYGRSNIGAGQRVMIEYFSPNTNKPLTVGHLRNIFLGWSISQILKELGYQVIESTLYNDRGIAICKAMVAYQKWGEGKTPKSEQQKPDHFIGGYYTMFYQRAKEQPELEQEAQTLLQQWEQGKRPVKKLWRQIIKWALEGFAQTLKMVGKIKFDEKYFESDIYTKGKDIILAGLAKGIFKKHAEGYIYAPLETHGMPEKILLRSDGTSLYIVQDIYLAKLKAEHKLDQSVYVVGSEQDLAMKQLFKIMEMLGENISMRHLSYGMMRLPEGKIKSREGLAKGTGADDLISTLDELARQEIIKRDAKLSDKLALARAHNIALAALKYYILEVDPKQAMVFDPKKSLAFAGKTGPYLQYVYARISSILKKSSSQHNINDFNLGVLVEPEELHLINLLSRFPGVLEQSAYNPSHLAHYLYDLARQFSNFYQKIPVLKAPDAQKNARLSLIKGVRIVIARGLKLLGIKPLERM